jgi:hypothetical protein
MYFDMHTFLDTFPYILYIFSSSSFHIHKINSFLTLSLTGVGPFGPSLINMKFALKVLKVRYRQKLGIPQAGS